MHVNHMLLSFVLTFQGPYSCIPRLKLAHMTAQVIFFTLNAAVPASFRSPSLQAHVEELPSLMTLGVLPTPWHGQIPLSCAYEVLRWLYEIYNGKMMQQQLFCHPSHSSATICMQPKYDCVSVHGAS